MKTEETKINWAAAFTINEPLHEFASVIGGDYAQMSFNSRNFTEEDFVKLGLNKEDFKQDYLHKEMLEWGKYESNIINLKFNSEEEGEKEVKRLGAICREQNKIAEIIANYKYGSNVK